MSTEEQTTKPEDTLFGIIAIVFTSVVMVGMLVLFMVSVISEKKIERDCVLVSEKQIDTHFLVGPLAMGNCMFTSCEETVFERTLQCPDGSQKTTTRSTYK